jgi:DNA polymerase-4
MERYQEMSDRIFGIFHRYTPLVEALSIDEAFLDVTASVRLFGTSAEIAKEIKAAVRKETGLTVSAGVAPNKFLAKIASGWKKPDGLTVVAPERVEHFLQALPVDALWGVGPVTTRKLRDRGIEKLVDVRAADPATLRDAVGTLAEWLQQLARGVDDRPVVSTRESKSSGSERTFATDVTDTAEIHAHITTMAREAAAWLVRRERYARTVTVKVRYDDFSTITRSHTEPPTRDEASIVERAVTLVGKTDAGRRPVRLVGVSVHNLTTDPYSMRDDRPGLPFDQ